MNTRFKLVAALGLALATGFVGVASAQTVDPSTQTPAATSNNEAAPVATPITKKAKSDRTRVTHRITKHRKMARKVGTTVHGKTSSLARKHLARVQGLHAKHAMNRAAKPTVIR